MNSSPSILSTDPFNILEESGSIVHVDGIPNEPINYFYESTNNQYFVISEVDTLTSPTHAIDDN